MTIVAFLAIFVLKVPFPFIVLAPGLLGFGFSGARPEPFSAFQKKKEGEKRTNGLDHKVHPNPTHPSSQTFSWNILAVCLVLWCMPFLVLILRSSPQLLFLQIYLFFTQAAFVTFGGAYAVLAYVNLSAINSYSRLTVGQMMDSFALAASIPRLLIIVLQFPFYYFKNTLYRTLERNRDLNEALSTITAAVVMNLAIVLDLSVLWRRKLEENSILALALSIAAFLALFWLKLISSGSCS